MIEAPMSGAPMRAKDASLTFMVGSKVNEFEKILPILNILGDKIYHIGEFGSGMSVKVLNNFVASCSVVAVRHVLSEAENLIVEELCSIADLMGDNSKSILLSKVQTGSPSKSFLNTIMQTNKTFVDYVLSESIESTNLLRNEEIRENDPRSLHSRRIQTKQS